MATGNFGLTDAKLKAMKPPASGQLEISDGAVPGLRIRIGSSGAQTFIVRKRIGGKPRNITVGRYSPRFGLADARKKARAILSDIEAGGRSGGGIADAAQARRDGEHNPGDVA
jgi:hypothetical protein